MKYNYKYVAAVVESAINENKLDGTELNYLQMHKKYLDDELKELEELRNKFFNLERTLLRLNKPAKFTDDDLIYSAGAKCECGAGLAYPKECFAYGMHYWDCSAILKGEADLTKKHTGQLPFAFYEVKSENQPSANGATTRPKKDDDVITVTV